jgi:peptidoglycan hydrolase-like protein with peptidoglycan-binding domain
MPTLKYGSNGDAVKQLQASLGIKTDGIFGPKTADAVKQYQTSNGLLADGIVGPKTTAKMASTPSAGQYGATPTPTSLTPMQSKVPTLTTNKKGIMDSPVSSANSPGQLAKMTPATIPTSTPKKIGGSALEIALGGAQMIGGLLTDGSASKPAPIQDNVSPVLNSMAMETKNAANSTASKLIDIAVNRADKDYASGVAEARRLSGGNAVAALMTGVNSAEQGKEAIAKASLSAADIVMQANQQTNQLGVQGAMAGLDVQRQNNQNDQQDYLMKKNAAGTLVGAGMNTILGSIGYKDFQDQEANVKAKNNIFKKTNAK